MYHLDPPKTHIFTDCKVVVETQIHSILTTI